VKEQPTTEPSAPVDRRYAFLVRASARLRLVENGDMDLTEAVAGLREAFEDILGHRLLCPCVRLPSAPPKRRPR
jgi:hypothetical protein